MRPLRHDTSGDSDWMICESRYSLPVPYKGRRRRYYATSSAPTEVCSPCFSLPREGWLAATLLLKCLPVEFAAFFFSEKRRTRSPSLILIGDKMELSEEELSDLKLWIVRTENPFTVRDSLELQLLSRKFTREEYERIDKVLTKLQVIDPKPPNPMEPLVPSPKPSGQMKFG